MWSVSRFEAIYQCLRLFLLLTCLQYVLQALTPLTLAAVYRSDNRDRRQPIFSVRRETVEGVVGTKVVLGCRVKYDQEYLIVWYKQKRTLTFNSRRVTDDSRFSVATGSLHEHVWDLQIDPVQLSDDDDYDCIINTKPPQKKTVKLVVKVPPRINFNAWNGERVLKEGSTYNVPCIATGKPPPNVTWYRERKDRPPQKIGHFDFNSDIYIQGSTLKFDRVNRSMEGSYMCVARNGVFPDAKKWIIIIVQFPPQVLMVNTKIGQRRGELTILQCKVWGNPVGKMSWQFNGIPLMEVPACHQHMEREKLCEDITKPFEDSRRISVDLTIRNITMRDYGTYTCISTSVMGVGRASTVLHEVIDAHADLTRYRVETPVKRPRYNTNPPTPIDNSELKDSESLDLSAIGRTNPPPNNDEEALYLGSWKNPKNTAGLPKSSSFISALAVCVHQLIVMYQNR